MRNKPIVESIGMRLRTGISVAGWSIREFDRRMKAKAARMAKGGQRLPGVSYPSLWAYLGDKRTPSLIYLHAAADELDVDYGWLVSGNGSSAEETYLRGRPRCQCPHCGEWLILDIQVKGKPIGLADLKREVKT